MATDDVGQARRERYLDPYAEDSRTESEDDEEERRMQVDDSDSEMAQWADPYPIVPGSDLRQSLENYRSAWLDQQTVPQLLGLARQRYLGDRIIPGMERPELVDLLISSQGGAHLYRRTTRELITLCRQQPLISNRDLGRCVERSDLVHLLLSLN